MNTLFIQFYSAYNKEVYAVYNGFSDTYDFCKNIGDFIWINENEMHTYKFPIKKGTIYVSAYFLKHLNQVVLWAKKNSNIKFIVGGPTIITDFNLDKYNFPLNIKLTTKSVEEYFGIPEFSQQWKLDINSIKHELKKYNTLLFSYTLDTSCYWKKCIFCNYHFVNNRKRQIIEPTLFESINFNGIKQVRLNSPGISGKQIKKLLPNLKYKKDITYDFLMRCNKSEYEALKIVLDSYIKIPNLKIRLGIEFPSNRMLQYINKGFTVNDILKTMKLIKSYENIKLYTTFMIGWPNLIEEDINNLKNFITKIPKIDYVSLHKTFCAYNTKLYDMYIKRKTKVSYEGQFLKGYYPDLTNEEIIINKRAKEIIKNISTPYFLNINNMEIK